jgi:Ca2+-dependent lipid-binding protein
LADTQKTRIVYESLDPEWNECLSFRNIDDEDLQEKYFEITVMDYDKLAKDKLIGTVNIDISPLLASKNHGHKL